MGRIQIVNLSLMLFCWLQTLSLAQAPYNNCDKALYLCPLITQNITNYDATKTLCPGCEDDFTDCFTPNNTIWLTFETNAAGGDVELNFTNVTIENAPNQGTEIQATILQAIAPCDASTYTTIGNCVTSATGNFLLSGTALLPNTTYYVVINGAKNTTANSAPAQATMDVTVLGPGVERIPPGVAILVPNDTLCLGETMLFSAYAGNCPDTANYEWYINDELVAITELNDFATSALQNGDVLSVKTACFEYCIVEINAQTPPFTVISFPVDAGPDFQILAGESVQLQGSTTAPNYSWSPDYTLSSPNVLKPFALPTTTTSYYLSATQDGCTFSDEAIVTVSEKLALTNTFTPNGDGFNDTWEIPSLEQYPNCFVEIYSRWGQLLYQTTGYSTKKAWDGKSNGKPVEPGVYFYVIDLRDSNYPDPIRGSLTLVR